MNSSDIPDMNWERVVPDITTINGNTDGGQTRGYSLHAQQQQVSCSVTTKTAKPIKSIFVTYITTQTM